jgi:antitoxin MazE
MIVEFCRWGNSLAVRIPKALADALRVSDGRRAEVRIENGALVLRPLLKPTRKPRYTIEELLSGMTKENAPQGVDWGPPRGNEAWWRGSLLAYCPEIGDIIWLDFLQSLANE